MIFEILNNKSHSLRLCPNGYFKEQTLKPYKFGVFFSKTQKIILNFLRDFQSENFARIKFLKYLGIQPSVRFLNPKLWASEIRGSHNVEPNLFLTVHFDLNDRLLWI